MTDTPPPSVIHQAQAAEVDQVVSALLQQFRDELDTQEPTVLAGATSAITRFAANAIKRQGGIPTVRQMNVMMARLVNFAAEQIAADPASRPSLPPPKP